MKPYFRILIDQDLILHWVNIGLLIAVIAFFALLALSFIRGLFRGWKFGTFRFLILGATGVTLVAMSGFWVDFIGNFNITQWVPSRTISIGSGSFYWQTGTVFESVYNFIYGLLHDIYQVKASPEALANYCIALAGSVIRLLLLVIIATLIETVGSILVWLLWHLIFKHFIPKARRHPKARVISGLQDAVIWLAGLVLMVAPISGLLNAIHNNGSLPETENENETIALVRKVINVYDESIFNKIFFAWTRGDGTDTMDTQLAEFFAQNSYTAGGKTYEVNIVKEVRVLSAVEGQLAALYVGDTAEDSLMLATLKTALLVGGVVWEAGLAENGSILDTLEPLAYDIAYHVDEAREVMDQAIVGSEANLAYRRLAAADVVTSIEDPVVSGLYSPCYDGLSSFSNQAISLAEQRMENDADARAFVNSVLSEYVLDRGDDMLVSSLLSCLDDPSILSEVDWWNEISVLSSFRHQVEGLSPKAASSSSGLLGGLGDSFLAAFADKASQVIDIIVGAREGKEPIVDDRGNNKGKPCLLDSDLMAIVLPSALEVGAHYLSESVLDANDPSDFQARVSEIAVELTGSSTKDTRINFKRELGAILDVAGELTSTEAGKNMIRDINNHPGLDFAEDGSLININPDLVQAAINSMNSIDGSKLLSYAGPILGDHFTRDIVSEGGQLYDMGITKLDFHSGHVGADLGELLTVAIYCNDLFSAIGSLFAKEGQSTFNPNVLLDAISNLETEESHYQITHLLDIVTGSPILNPVIDGAKNKNVVALFNYIFEQLGDNFDVSISADDLANVDLPSKWNGNEIDKEHLGENYRIARCFKVIVDTGVIENLANLDGHSAGYALRNLGKIDVRALFTAIGESEVMRTITPGFFDEFMLGTLINGDKAMDLETIGVSYYNLKTPADWAREGEAMQAVLDLATRGLDLSNLDLFNSTTITLLEELSQSGMFYVPESSGEKTYVFGEFMKQKLLLSLSDKDMLKFFTDYPAKNIDEDVAIGTTTEHITGTVKDILNTRTDWNMKETLKLKTVLCSDFCRAIDLLDTRAEWEEEFGVLGNTISALGAAGGLDAFNDLDAKILPALTVAVRNLTLSRSFGVCFLGNVFEAAFTSDSLPAIVAEAKINTGWFYVNAEQYLDAAESGASAAEIKVITDHRSAEIENVLSLINVLLGNESIKDATGNVDLNFGTLNVDTLLRPLLNTAYSSVLLNPRNAADTYEGVLPETTAFENILLVFLKESGVYADHSGTAIADYDTPVRGSNKTLRDIVDSVSDWDAEIETICELVSLLQDSSFLNDEGKFDLSVMDDLPAYFAKQSSVNELQNMLLGLEESELFYRCLPGKLEDALNNGLANLTQENLKNDLKCADFYLNDTAGDFAPYDADEVSHLISIFANLASCANMDMNDLATIDIDPLLSALEHMGQSAIFNSNVDKAATVFAPGDIHEGLTCFQGFLADTLWPEALQDYYFLPASPKDAAASYTTMSEKVRETVTACFDTLDLHNLAGSRETVADETHRYLSGEWKDAFSVLKRDSFAGFIAQTSQLSDLKEGDFALLLEALNNCTLYYDCVPNALYKVLIADATLTVDGIDLSAADPYFSYYFHDGNHGFSPTRKATPDFSMRFYPAEIDQIAALYSSLMDNQSVLTTMTMNSIDDLMLRDLFLDLSDSYVFHMAREKNHGTTHYDATIGTFTDLSVFEQFVYKFFITTTLSNTNFKMTQDYQYFTLHGADGHRYKTHDSIVAFSESPTYSWLDEIEAITTDGHHHAGTDDDPVVGLIAAGKYAGIFSSGSEFNLDFNVLNSLAPSGIKTLLYAANKCQVLDDFLHYGIENLLGVNDSGDGLGLTSYSGKDYYYDRTDYTVIDTATFLDFYDDGDATKAYHSPTKVSVHTLTEPTFTAALSDGTDVTSAVAMTYDSPARKAHFVTNGFPLPITITLDQKSIGSVVAHADFSLFDIGRQNYEDKGIPALGYILSSVYRGTNGGTRTSNLYFSFGNGAATLQDFYDDYPAKSDYRHSTYGLLALFAASGFYDTPISVTDGFASTENLSHNASAFSFYNALKFDIAVDVDVEISPGVKLPSEGTISIGDHIGKETTSLAHEQNIYDILSGFTVDSIAEFVREAYWMDHYAPSAGTADAMAQYEHLVLTTDDVGGFDISSPTIKYIGIAAVESSFAKTPEAMGYIDSFFQCLSYDYDMTVPMTLNPADDLHFVATGASSILGSNIIADIITDLGDIKAVATSLEYDAPTLTFGTSPKYTRIGAGTKPVTFDDDFYWNGTSSDKYIKSVAPGSYPNLTDAYVAEVRSNFTILSQLCGDTPDNTILHDAFLTLGGEAIHLSDLFYVTTVYDQMLSKHYYTMVSPGVFTDMPFLNAEGRINNVSTPFSYPTIASLFA